MSNRWLGVDFDHTLCREDGSPVGVMVDRVKKWISCGITVKIVTARLNHDFKSQKHGKLCMVDGWCEPGCAFRKYGESRVQAISIIQRWCFEHIGIELPVVCEKGPSMIELWDDRAVRVEKNTGRKLSPSEVDPGCTVFDEMAVIRERMRCLKLVHELSQGTQAWNILAEAIISGKRTTL